jgi:hypothetical protein
VALGFIAATNGTDQVAISLAIWSSMEALLSV